MKKDQNRLCMIAFLQAFGLVLYCSLVALLFWRGNEWFGKMTNYLGPLLFLMLFAASALISALLTLGYPVYLFWQKKERVKALKVASYTAGWLVFFILLTLFCIIYFRGRC